MARDRTENVAGVLVVDDSAFMRKLIGEMIAAEPDLRVAGFARNGVEAMDQIAALDPELITLDLEMPQLDGMQVLEQVMARAPRRVVVLSAGGAAHGDATIRALELGAIDVVQKPSGPISLDLERIRGRLIAALRAAALVDPGQVRALAARSTHGESSGAPEGDATARETAQHVIAIASSTGGPRALSEIIPALPATLPAAVVIAQHMPKEFTASLAHRLDRASAVRVCEARDGEPLLAGCVYIAPGGQHMRISHTRVSRASALHGAACIVLDPCDASGLCPSADALFDSVAAAFGARATAVVLTGMGRDGSAGAHAIRSAGGRVVVQDRETSVIYGMPAAALQAAGADHVVALQDVARTIVSCAQDGAVHVG
jgi:two-component system chemotaxis response regulator CheB